MCDLGLADFVRDATLSFLLVADLRVGDTVALLPNHACGVVNMWGTVHVLDEDGAVQTWHPVGRH